MPLVDSNDAALWDGREGCPYRIPVGDLAFGYVRPAAQNIMGNDPQKLIEALVSKGLQQGQRIALIGGGFGWVGEAFIASGYGPAANGTASGKIAVVDTSTWIQNNKNANAQLSISNADVNAATGRRAIRQLFGSNNAEVHWIISEDVLPGLIGPGPTPSGNNEIVPFCQNLRSLASVGVAHWVSVGTASSDPRYNWKTLEEWKAWVTPDFVIQRGTATVL